MKKCSHIKLNYRQALKETNKYFVTIKLQFFYDFQDDWKCLPNKDDIESPGIVKASAVTEVFGKVLTPFRNVKLWRTEAEKKILTKGNTMEE